MSVLLFFFFLPIQAHAFEKLSDSKRIESESRLVLHKLMEDIRHCDKTVGYQYDSKSRQISPPELKRIRGLKLKKLRREIAIFQIDETYAGMHAVALVLGRSQGPYSLPIHAIAFRGKFEATRQRLEVIWNLRFTDGLRPGPDAIADGEYAEVEILVDEKRRTLSVERMPLDVYPNIGLPVVSCNHVEN